LNVVSICEPRTIADGALLREQVEHARELGHRNSSASYPSWINRTWALIPVSTGDRALWLGRPKAGTEFSRAPGNCQIVDVALAHF
jgi:hypothetical protein